MGSPLFHFLDALGLIPFLLFLVSPLAFAQETERNFLLVIFVVLGAYLGLTALFEATHTNALVWPKYILDPAYGNNAEAGRVRGPFAAAVQNGFGLFSCTVVALVATATWRAYTARLAAMAVGALCLLGAVLTLQRSIWLATVLASLIVLITARRLARTFLIMASVAAIAVVLSLTFISDLRANVMKRSQDAETVWERRNMATAALGMVEAKPLVGFGWGTFPTAGGEYFRQSANYPLVGTQTIVHNVYLSYASELGLIGVSLWVLGFIFGIGGAAFSKTSREMRPWRDAVMPLAGFYLVVIYFIPPPTGLSAMMVWLSAGIVLSNPYAAVSKNNPFQPRTTGSAGKWAHVA